MTSRRPNIIFVLTDDQGYGDLGCHGNQAIRTPNLDRFHGQCVRFTDYHVGTTCAPTRCGLMTGHYCNSAGVWHTIGGRSLMREDEWTLPAALREAGYRTGHFGKWHLGDAHPLLPHERGFEVSVYHGGGGVGNTPDPWGNDYFDDTYFVNGVMKKFTGYCTDVFFGEAMKFIERHADEPFFCYLATNAPHGPHYVEKEYSDMYGGSTPHDERAKFYGMVTNIDENFGRLCARLDELGLTEDTVLVFMTDNGTAGGVETDADGFVQEGPGTFNAHMRGQKGSPYEGGHRVPLFIRYPAGGIVGPRDVDALTSYVDFMPTLLELAEVEVPAGRSFHGRSLLPLIRGQADEYWAQRVTVADTQRVATPVQWRLSSAMKQKWRLVNGTELYDLAGDPGQRTNVADEHPDVVAEIRAGYEKWWAIVSEQFDRDVPFAIGDTDETVRLTTHDIRNETAITAWHQYHVRTGLAVSGWWEIDVRKAGRYAFELRRWPEEAGHAIAAGIEGDDVEWRRDIINPRRADRHSGGTALDIRWAQLTIQGRNYQAEVDGARAAATFEVDLTVGPDHLFAAFYDKKERTIAPYYIYIRKL
jgi:arylsulfatase A-like enzyme